MSILNEVLNQKEIYEKRKKEIEAELKRLEDTDDKEKYYIRWGQLMEMNYVLYQFFHIDE